MAGHLQIWWGKTLSKWSLPKIHGSSVLLVCYPVATRVKLRMPGCEPFHPVAVRRPGEEREIWGCLFLVADTYNILQLYTIVTLQLGHVSNLDPPPWVVFPFWMADLCTHLYSVYKRYAYLFIETYISYIWYSLVSSFHSALKCSRPCNIQGQEVQLMLPGTPLSFHTPGSIRLIPNEPGPWARRHVVLWPGKLGIGSPKYHVLVCF